MTDMTAVLQSTMTVALVNTTRSLWHHSLRRVCDAQMTDITAGLWGVGPLFRSPLCHTHRHQETISALCRCCSAQLKRSVCISALKALLASIAIALSSGAPFATLTWKQGAVPPLCWDCIWEARHTLTDPMKSTRLHWKFKFLKKYASIRPFPA